MLVEDLLSLNNCKHNVPCNVVDSFIGVFFNFFKYGYGRSNILRVTVLTRKNDANTKWVLANGSRKHLRSKRIGVLHNLPGYTNDIRIHSIFTVAKLLFSAELPPYTSSWRFFLGAIRLIDDTPYHATVFIYFLNFILFPRHASLNGVCRFASLFLPGTPTFPARPAWAYAIRSPGNRSQILEYE